MKQQVIIFGTGVFGRIAYNRLSGGSSFDVAAFTADRRFCDTPSLFGLPVTPFEDIVELFPPDRFSMLVALGYQRTNRLKEEKFRAAKAAGYKLVSFVSPDSAPPPKFKLGENCFIGPNTVIDPSVVIGDNVSIGSGCVVPHDCRIEDHCFLADGVLLGGNAHIEANCFIGIGAIIRNRARIRRECVVGAGAVILQDTRERGVYVGRSAEELPVTSDQLPPS